MRPIESLSDQERRHLVHIYAALREHIADELAYDRTPDFPALDPEAEETLHQAIYDELARLMRGAHPAEAAQIEQRLAAEWAYVSVVLAEEPGAARGAAGTPIRADDDD